jgi:muramoyltetrapeptide carboxypeptidase LdcA involved in peptidoglycan recycling
VLRPSRLSEGSVVAIVSPSWGGPHAFPKVYAKGLEVLREDLGLEIREMNHARASQSYLRRYPQMRAQDINDAFLDPEVDAIIASVGGDDSIRALPFLDLAGILRHPKVLMGFSDTTTLLTYLSLKGLVTYHGPSVMAGIAQMRNYPRQLEHVRDLLFHPQDRYVYRPAAAFNEGYPDWANDDTVGRVLRKKRSAGWTTLQGAGRARGRLFGGCIEVLEMMKATRFWPPPDFWEGKVLFLETSELEPSPAAVKFILRNYGMIGALDGLSALLLGRPRGYSREKKVQLQKNVLEVVADEFGRGDLPIVSNLDIGHTDPQMVLPLGLRVEVDPAGPYLTLLEPPVD